MKSKSTPLSAFRWHKAPTRAMAACLSLTILLVVGAAARAATITGLGDFPGGIVYSGTGGVSADGSVVVGSSSSGDSYEAFRWTSDGGMVGLRNGPAEGITSRAFSVSADGSVIVGRTGNNASGFEGTAFGAFVWTEAAGIRNLASLLNESGVDLADWSLNGDWAVSDDGRFIVGTGHHFGNLEAFIVDMGVTLAADLTHNGFVDFEDLTVLLANWNKQVGADAGNLVNADTTPVNFEDLTVLLADWTGPAPAAAPEGALGAEAVPEPSTIVLAALALLGLSAFTRRRTSDFSTAAMPGLP